MRNSNGKFEISSKSNTNNKQPKHGVDWPECDEVHPAGDIHIIDSHGFNVNNEVQVQCTNYRNKPTCGITRSHLRTEDIDDGRL